MMLSDLLIKYILAPLIVEVIVRFMQRRAVDPEFKKHSDEVFARVGTASTKEDFDAGAKDLQTLISQ